MNFSIFINPTTGLLNVFGNFNEETSVKIINNIGQVVLSFKTPTNFTIDLSDLKKGLYFIKIKSDNESMTRSIIVK